MYRDLPFEKRNTALQKHTYKNELVLHLRSPTVYGVRGDLYVWVIKRKKGLKERSLVICRGNVEVKFCLF